MHLLGKRKELGWVNRLVWVFRPSRVNSFWSIGWAQSFRFKDDTTQYPPDHGRVLYAILFRSLSRRLTQGSQTLTSSTFLHLLLLEDLKYSHPFQSASAQAYGPIGHVDETTPVNPPVWAPYSRSKAAAEKVVLEANAPPRFESKPLFLGLRLFLRVTCLLLILVRGSILFRLDLELTPDVLWVQAALDVKDVVLSVYVTRIIKGAVATVIVLSYGFGHNVLDIAVLQKSLGPTIPTAVKVEAPGSFFSVISQCGAECPGYEAPPDHKKIGTCSERCFEPKGS